MNKNRPLVMSFLRRKYIQKTSFFARGNGIHGSSFLIVQDTMGMNASEGRTLEDIALALELSNGFDVNGYPQVSQAVRELLNGFYQDLGDSLELVMHTGSLGSRGLQTAVEMIDSDKLPELFECLQQSKWEFSEKHQAWVLCNVTPHVNMMNMLTFIGLWVEFACVPLGRYERTNEGRWVLVEKEQLKETSDLFGDFRAEFSKETLDTNYIKHLIYLAQANEQQGVMDYVCARLLERIERYQGK